MEEITTAILAPIVRHGLTTAGGLLVGYGVLDPSLQGQFVAVTSGIALSLVGMAWSLRKNIKTYRKK